MRVLADGDLLLEFFANRKGRVEAAEKLLEMVQSQQIEMYVTDQCLDKLRFYLSKGDAQFGEDTISKIEAMLEGYILPISQNLIQKALTYPLPDFESAVEMVCATAMNLDAIITQNQHNFAEATLPIWSVDELLKQQQLVEILEQQYTKSRTEWLELQTAMNLDAIITQNQHNFAEATLPVWSVDELLKQQYTESRAEWSQLHLKRVRQCLERSTLVRRLTKRYPFYAQQSASDCGAACLVMIGRYWGKQFSISLLRDLANTNRSGASIKDLVAAAESIGFSTRPVKASLAALAQQSLPAIAHWEGKHYIVVYEINTKR
ncbi:hypothetical protein AMR41_11435, partial [Hapalosiphon sp. MRB220]